MHLQPLFATHVAFGGDVSARLFERGLCLPSGSALTDGQQDRVVAAVLGTQALTVPVGFSQTALFRPTQSRCPAEVGHRWRRQAGAATVSTTSSQWLQFSERPLTASRYARCSSSVTGPTPSSTSSTARTGVTSAAVPVMKSSSAR